MKNQRRNLLFLLLLTLFSAKTSIGGNLEDSLKNLSQSLEKRIEIPGRFNNYREKGKLFPCKDKVIDGQLFHYHFYSLEGSMNANVMEIYQIIEFNKSKIPITPGKLIGVGFDLDSSGIINMNEVFDYEIKIHYLPKRNSVDKPKILDNSKEHDKIKELKPKKYFWDNQATYLA